MKNNNSGSLKENLCTMMYFLKLSHGISKAYIPVLLLSSIFKAFLPFVNIIMPKFIIDELMGSKRIDIFIILVSITVALNAILNVLNKSLDTIVELQNNVILDGFDLLIGEKIMRMDFEKIEDPEILDLKERSIYALQNQNVIPKMIKSLVTLVSQIIIVIGLVAVISTLNVLIILLIVLIVLLNSLIFKKTQEMEFKISEELIPINRKFQYYAQTTSDFSLGKDMRLYNIAPLMMDKIIRYNKESIALFKEMSSSNGRYSGLTEINVQFQMIAVYGYMAYKVLSHSIGIGDFTMYINSAIGFSNSISKSIDNFIQFRQMCRYLGPYLEFEKIKSANTLGGRKVEVSQRYSIEFRNVYFKYPKSNDYTLKNVSINIHNGEKLSIVGLNGAGKTTFIKLLTRLYEPTSGEILLNGVNIKEYDYREYMKLLSVVFQDFKLMAFSVKENIALENSEQHKDSKILDTLKKSGLDNDISKLDRGMHTPVYKTFEKDGIEFSGGQSQKLAISRAIFKDSPIVILDEPTAALDPIAEYEIYSKFNELIGDKTTIYISHRLSSCRFCDRIAVFHNGEIVQYGTHDELIAQSGSQYEIMYMAQAQYYV